MEIIVAKTAGFCFGVDKAVNAVYKLINNSNGQIYTLGSIIHNDQVVNQLEEKGVKVIEGIGDESLSGDIVIRAHGITPEVYKELKSHNLHVVDATCPYVKKIHRLVRGKYLEGYQIIIVGDINHPEVIGIKGWSNNSAIIINDLEEANSIQDNFEKVCVVAQTTITREKWNLINEVLDKKFKNIIKFDTICNATITRQAEAKKIAQQVDMMIVLGGTSSSNTQKLYDICKKYCSNTYKVETADDLPSVDINKIKKIGITAGASTQEWVIKEVIEKMNELNKQEQEMSFEEAFEQNSLKEIHTGNIVKGVIAGFNNSEIYVDLGYKYDGIIPIHQYTEDPNFKPENSVKVGDEIEAFVIRVNDIDGNVLLSKKRIDAQRSLAVIEEAFNNKLDVDAQIIEVVNGGVIANAGGVRVFVPASQASDRFVKDLKSILNNKVTLRIVEFNKQKRRIVGSCRVVLEERKASQQENIWSEIEIGKKYTGTVKSITDFGVFVDIGGVDGLIHISELSWNKVSHPSKILSIGDEVQVYIQDFDKDKNRISLGYKKAEDNPWFNAEERFALGSTVTGKVVRIVPFGAFISLADGVDGLVHISQISNVRLAKPSDVLEVGQTVEAKVIELDLQAKKIGLSIKEINPMDPVKPEEKLLEAGEEEPTEYREEMVNTIEIPSGIFDEE